MPIKGLTDMGQGFPELGTLRKGAPKGINGPGKDLEYFRFDTTDVNAQLSFTAIYGTNPQAVNVYLPYASTEENLETWQEAYSAGALQHRCDGETMQIWLTPQNTYSKEPTPCAGGCKPVGRLKVIIPELKRLAYVTVLTTSVHDILALSRNLRAVEALRRSLTGIPFIIRRSPRNISVPKNGKRVRTVKWLLSIEPDTQWVAMQLTAAAQTALPHATTVLQAPTLALPAWDDDIDDDIDDHIDDEMMETETHLSSPILETSVSTLLNVCDLLKDYYTEQQILRSLSAIAPIDALTADAVREQFTSKQVDIAIQKCQQALDKKQK